MAIPHSSSEFEDAYDPEGDRSALADRLFEDALSDVPRPPLLTVDADASALDAILRMNEQRVGCALVVRDGRLAGIFTERDVLARVAARAIDPAEVSVADVMTPEPATLPQSASVAFALHKMRVEGYRHIPLVDDDGGPVGVVAVRDIICWMVDLFPGRVLNLPPDPRQPSSAHGG